jgi:hypothetical protein
MFCKRITIQLRKKDDSFHLRPLGDIHLGNIGRDVDKLQKHIDFVRKRPDYYTVGMGDFIDNISAYAGGQVDKRRTPKPLTGGT